MPTQKTRNPFGKFNFLVEIDGITSAGFKDVSGLDDSTGVGTYREGNDPTLGLRKLPGLLQSSNITLSRGITANAELWSWRRSVASGEPDRRNISIILADERGQPQIQWDLRNAWPVKWTGPSLDATSGDAAIEQLEIAHEGLSVQKW